MPPCSVLGPILFLIFIDDIDDDLISYILKFADDTKVYNTVMNDDDHQKLQGDLTTMEIWMDQEVADGIQNRQMQGTTRGEIKQTLPVCIE